MALQCGSDIVQRRTVEPRSHARKVLPWARELLAAAGLGFSDLDSLVVSRGPGGFTSLRIGLGIVQGLALARDLPVHPVSSLATLAEAADPEGRIDHLLALLDARMGQVYAAWYRLRDGHRQRVASELLANPDRLEAPERGDWTALGPGAAAFRDALAASLGKVVRLPDPAEDIVWPDARALLRLAETTPPTAADRITPAYLRDQVTG